MNREIFENIYNKSLNSKLQEYSYDMSSHEIVEFFKKELFHPSVEYDSQMKAAMSSCIRLLSSMRDSKEYGLNDVYKILESLYKGISKLSEGTYADNLGNDIDNLLRKAEDSFNDLTAKRVLLDIKDSEIPDVENKLFALADLYSRTFKLLLNHDNFRSEQEDILDQLKHKFNNVINPIFDNMKQILLNLNLRNIKLYHSVGNHEEIESDDLNLEWYLKNLKFVDVNTIHNAFAA